MEASMAAEASGDEGTQEAGAAQAPAVDLSPVMSQIEQFGGQLGQMQQIMSQFSPPATEETDEAYDALQAFYAEQDQGAPMDAETASKLVDDLVEQRLGAKLDQVLKPIQGDLEAMRAESDAKHLMDKYPEFQDFQVAQKIVQNADQFAQKVGVPPEVARRAGFIEMVYKAQRYDQQAAGEMPVGDLSNATLEPGGGASPRGGGNDSGDIAQQIRTARGGNSFWGT